MQSNQKKVRILIADDHNMFIDGINLILKAVDDLALVGKCNTGQAIFDFLAKDENIDLILLDINMPDISGVEVSKLLKERYPSIKILVLSMYNEESYIHKMLQNGAAGYLLKDADGEELIKAIRLVQQGSSYFSQDVTQTIMKSLMTHQNAKPKKMDIPKISRREKEILHLVVAEKTNQEIAKELFISLKTVEAHRSSLLHKLEVRNTAGLVKMAIKKGLIKL